MEKIDYEKMADEYLQQAQVLEEKIEKRRRRKSFPSAQEREQNEKAIVSLYQMKRDAIAIHHLLRRRAAEIQQEGKYA